MVATLPIYALLLCMIFECTLMLQVKIGTMYAAYAAARSAAVWYPAETSQAAIERKVKTAAVQAIAPFSSSREEHLRGISAAGGGDVPDAEALHAAYAAYCGGPITLHCLHNKLNYAWQATQVSVEPSTSGPNADLTVTVRYQMPFHTAIGYCLGGRRSPGGLCLREIQTTVTLQKEGAKSPTQKLGIHYDPDHN
jgi:Flp pilus assembly protein TadG